MVSYVCTITLFVYDNQKREFFEKKKRPLYTKVQYKGTENKNSEASRSD